MGGRLPLLNPHDTAPAQRQALDVLEGTFLRYADQAGFRARDAEGHLVGPFNSALYSPEISAAFLLYQTAEQQHSTLDRRVREVVILTVGAIWRSAYELYAHAIVARRTGLPGAAIDALRAGAEPETLTDDQRVAHRLARALTVDRRIDTDLFARGEEAFGRQGMVDLVHLVGAYQTVCGLLNAFAIPAPAAD